MQPGVTVIVGNWDGRNPQRTLCIHGVCTFSGHWQLEISFQQCSSGTDPALSLSLSPPRGFCASCFVVHINPLHAIGSFLEPAAPKGICWFISFRIASFSGSPEREYVYTGRAWYLFSHEHDVIEIGPEFLEQKGNVLSIVQPNMRSTLSVYDICSPTARYV